MLTEQQKRTAQAIVNIFETGTAEGNYADVTLIPGDPGHLTYGRSQTTLGSGNLYLLIKDYCAAPNTQYAAGLTPYLARLQAKDLSLDNDGNLKRLLKQAGNAPVMQATQDAFFDRVYWTPAINAAQTTGHLLPLSIAVVYDSHIHGSWPLVRDKTHKNVGQVAAVGEKAWIEGYVKTRREWLANHSIQILHNTVYRMEAFQSLIRADNWDLEPPIVVRGVTISVEKVGLPLKIVMLANNSVIECHPRVENGTTRVDMRPVCDALKIALPTGAALTALNPREIPPGVTRVDLRPLMEESGWEVLANHLAEQNKIYLRKRG
jgi:chitosanase